MYVIEMSSFLREDSNQVLMDRVKPLIEWAYMADDVSPRELYPEERNIVIESSHSGGWSTVS